MKIKGFHGPGGVRILALLGAIWGVKARPPGGGKI